MKVKEKIARIVSAMLLSGMIMGVVIAPLSVAAAGNSLEECVHNYQQMPSIILYVQASTTVHVKEIHHRLGCARCSNIIEWVESVSEAHDIGSDGYCSACGYRFF